MRLVTKVGIWVLVALLPAAPTMACLLPSGTLTTAERKCCRDMAGKCGSTGMSSSHSCCQQLASPDSSSFVASGSQQTLDCTVTGAAQYVTAAVQVPAPVVTPHVRWFDAIHGPPEFPPANTSVLRI